MEATLVQGATGTGKTATMIEPMCAGDIEKKFFFRETSKELGFTALKTRIATLNCPYDNDYLNANFTYGRHERRVNKILEIENEEK